MASFKILLIFELPNERVMQDGAKAQTVSKEFTCSLSEKANLRKVLESWRGRPFTKEELEGFDVMNVVDVPCMINVIHKQSGAGKTYADIAAITSLPKGTQPLPRVNELVRYEIEHGRNDVFKSLPEFIQKKIEVCEEWIHPTAAVQQSQEVDPADKKGDDVPF